MTSFTPFSALVGGALIGLSAVIFLYANGRIAGISGIISGLLRWNPGDRGWRLAFIAGLVAGAGSYLWLAPPAFIPRTDFSTVKLVIAGLLVGFGTAMGSGCTSGHGVCGISRLSPRSILATLLFLSSAMLTVYLLKALSI